MIIMMKKSAQMALFDMPVHVVGSVDKRGRVRAAHIAIRKKMVAASPADASQSDPLSAWMAKHGGASRVSEILVGMTPEQRGKLIDAMAMVGGVSHADVMDRIGILRVEAPPQPETPTEPAVLPEVFVDIPPALPDPLERLRSKVADMGGKAAVALALNENWDAATDWIVRLSDHLNIDPLLIYAELGMPPPYE